MVGEEAGHDPPQPEPLDGDRLVPPSPQLLLDRPEPRPHAVAPALPLDLEAATARGAADEGEAQEGEGLRLAEPARSASGRRTTAELDQAGLVRVQRQRELLQPLAHRVPKAPGVGLVLEADHDVGPFPTVLSRAAIPDRRRAPRQRLTSSPQRAPGSLCR